MDILVTKPIFNPYLLGKAVYVKGYDADGHLLDKVFLVKEANYDSLTLLSSVGVKSIITVEDLADSPTREDMSPDGIKITVLEGQD